MSFSLEIDQKLIDQGLRRIQLQFNVFVLDHHVRGTLRRFDCAYTNMRSCVDKVWLGGRYPDRKDLPDKGLYDPKKPDPLWALDDIDLAHLPAWCSRVSASKNNMSAPYTYLMSAPYTFTMVNV